jgi:hypothetical protein
MAADGYCGITTAAGIEGIATGGMKMAAGGNCGIATADRIGGIAATAATRKQFLDEIRCRFRGG